MAVELEVDDGRASIDANAGAWRVEFGHCQMSRDIASYKESVQLTSCSDTDVRLQASTVPHKK